MSSAQICQVMHLMCCIPPAVHVTINNHLFVFHCITIFFDLMILFTAVIVIIFVFNYLPCCIHPELALDGRVPVQMVRQVRILERESTSEHDTTIPHSVENS